MTNGSGSGRTKNIRIQIPNTEFYSSDQYPGHPDAVNSMVAATDNVLITACEDGIIRAVHLFPHRFIGQVGTGGHLS
jgi:hypothetical protein